MATGTKVADVRAKSDDELKAMSEAKGVAFDRLFLTGAIRSDRNSAFGADFKTVFYPKVAVSYVLARRRSAQMV